MVGFQVPLGQTPAVGGVNNTPGQGISALVTGYMQGLSWHCAVLPLFLFGAVWGGSCSGQVHETAALLG